MFGVAPANRADSHDRSRRAVVVTLWALAALAWLITIAVARSPAAMSAMPGQVSATAAVLFSGMWLGMMAAMMLPAITPVVLLFRTVQRGRGERGSQMVPMTAFVSGYLVVWVAAGLAAYLMYGGVQAVAADIHAAGLIPYIGGAILVLAGLYQVTPLKNACLKHCRSPLHFIMHGWRDGRVGALRMGIVHGAYCLGCCWGIMAVLFVVGLMNLGWMAALSLLIIVEKLAPRGVAIGRAVGVLFVALGLLMAVQPRLFPASGLAMSSGTTMAGMGGNATSMHGMGSAGSMRTTARGAGSMHGMAAGSGSTTARTSYRAVAGPYALALTIGAAETMLTPAQARRTHARSGEIMLDGMMPGTMPMGGMQRHLEVHVSDVAMGMAVTNARVTASLQGAGAPGGTLTLVRMYGVKEGMKDLHYGANLTLDRGMYSVRVRVNGRTATFHVRVS